MWTQDQLIVKEEEQVLSQEAQECSVLFRKFLFFSQKVPERKKETESLPFLYMKIIT